MTDAGRPRGPERDDSAEQAGGSVTDGARRLVLALLALLILDCAVWAAHVRWRDSGVADLAPLVREIESLAVSVADDDRWIERNTRLFQEYAQHQELGERMIARGRRARAHDVMVERYNAEIDRLYRRFYLAPVPAPPRPYREKLPDPPEPRR